MNSAWSKDANANAPFHPLLSNLVLAAKGLKSWNTKGIIDINLRSTIFCELIIMLDMVVDNRRLLKEEFSFIRFLKDV